MTDHAFLEAVLAEPHEPARLLVYADGLGPPLARRKDEKSPRKSLDIGTFPDNLYYPTSAAGGWGRRWWRPGRPPTCAPWRGCALTSGTSSPASTGCSRRTQPKWR